MANNEQTNKFDVLILSYIFFLRSLQIKFYRAKKFGSLQLQCEKPGSFLLTENVFRRGNNTSWRNEPQNLIDIKYKKYNNQNIFLMRVGNSFDIDANASVL